MARDQIDNGPESWLGATEKIDKDNPFIRETVGCLIDGAQTDRERAQRIYEFVRDEIRFGWTPDFDDLKASQVLAVRRGYCNTKATLFIALLRAIGIPARQHFVDLRSDILSGLMPTGGPYMDHSYTEVFLDGRWIGVDSYVIDRPLFLTARTKLKLSARRVGFGLHRNGVNEWDGRTDSFIQFVDDGSVAGLSLKDYGVRADVSDFGSRAGVS